MVDNVHRVINRSDLQKLLNLKGLSGKIISGLGMYILGMNKLNKLYNDSYNTDANIFIENAFKLRNNKIHISDKDLNNIPKTGPIIFVANHPLGGWDGIALITTITKVRPDLKIMMNYLLNWIKPIEKYSISVNPFENNKSLHSNYKGLKEMYSHLNNGNCIVFFPAGEVSTKYGKLKRIEDREWQPTVVKFIQKANVPVIPIHITGKNSFTFHFLGRIQPRLRTFRLPMELANMKNSTVKLRIGSPIHIRHFKSIDNTLMLGRTLKALTYCLNEKAEETSEFDINFKPEEIVQQSDKVILCSEIEAISSDCLLFSQETYSCFFADNKRIPNLFNEICRQREITFRSVGEGTGNETDKDKYDDYYKHLFIWDNKENCLVGAYRIGMGQQILKEMGIEGFYLHTLFKFKRSFESHLGKSMELGRSFIVESYQRKTLPLYLLWKGINFISQKNPEYQYLIGPVSMSSMFSVNSKILLLEFLKQNYSNKKLGKHVNAILPFKYRLNRHHRNLLKFCGKDIQKLDKIIRCIDANNFTIPVLIKKYVSLGGKIIEFNVDPDFNYAIDGLVILDIDTVSDEVRKDFE